MFAMLDAGVQTTNDNTSALEFTKKHRSMENLNFDIIPFNYIMIAKVKEKMILITLV